MKALTVKIFISLLLIILLSSCETTKTTVEDKTEPIALKFILLDDFGIPIKQMSINVSFFGESKLANYRSLTTNVNGEANVNDVSVLPKRYETVGFMFAGIYNQYKNIGKYFYLNDIINKKYNFISTKKITGDIDTFEIICKLEILKNLQYNITIVPEVLKKELERKESGFSQNLTIKINGNKIDPLPINITENNNNLITATVNKKDNPLKIDVPKHLIKNENEIVSTYTIINDTYGRFSQSITNILGVEEFSKTQEIEFGLPMVVAFKNEKGDAVSQEIIKISEENSIRNLVTDARGQIYLHIKKAKFPIMLSIPNERFFLETELFKNRVEIKQPLEAFGDVNTYFKNLIVYDAIKKVNLQLSLSSYENLQPSNCDFSIDASNENGEGPVVLTEGKNGDIITVYIKRNTLNQQYIHVFYNAKSPGYFALSESISIEFNNPDQIIPLKFDHPIFYVHKESRAHLWDKLNNRENVKSIIYDLILNDLKSVDNYQFKHGCLSYLNEKLNIKIISPYRYNTRVYAERQLAGFLFDFYIRKAIRIINNSIQKLSKTDGITAIIYHSISEGTNSSKINSINRQGGRESPKSYFKRRVPNSCEFTLPLDKVDAYVKSKITGRELLSEIITKYDQERIEPDLY